MKLWHKVAGTGGFGLLRRLFGRTREKTNSDDNKVAARQLGTLQP